MDYFLKAASEADLHAALAEASVVVINDAVVDDAGEVLIPAHDSVADGFALDVIGQISKPTGGTLTVDGMEVPEMAPVAGYHANLRGELSDTQLAILEPILLDVAPANPFRVWAEVPPPVVIVEDPAEAPPEVLP